MICRKCRDLHAGENLGTRDGGISFSLGDCRGGGTPGHQWRKVNFIADAPYIQQEGSYRATKVTVAAAQAYSREPWVSLGVRNCPVAKMLAVVLDAPIVHLSNPYIRLDVGDRLLGPIFSRIEFIKQSSDLTRLEIEKDYTLLVIERTA